MVHALDSLWNVVFSSQYGSFLVQISSQDCLHNQLARPEAGWFVLVVGHSFILNLKNFIRQNNYLMNLNLDPKEVMVQYSGIRGGTISSMKKKENGNYEWLQAKLDINSNWTKLFMQQENDPGVWCIGDHRFCGIIYQK